MPKVHYLQSSFVAGVLHPQMAARTDVRQYYQGMSVGENVQINPLGGAGRRPGTEYIATLPNALNNISSAATYTAPNGGTANNARDDDSATTLLTTTNLSNTAGYVVVHVDLGAVQTVKFVDVLQVFITAGATSDFAVGYSSDNVTFFFDNVMPLTTDARRHRVHFNVNARYLKFYRVATDDGDLGTAKIQLADFIVWAESANTSVVNLDSFEFSDDENYAVALTHRSASIYDKVTGDLVASIPTRFLESEVPDVDVAQTATVMILTHQNHRPQRIIRIAADTWYAADVAFTALPQYDFNDDDSPTPTSDVQTLTFTDFVEGDTFQIELEGARTSSIAYQGENASTAANIAREVQKLYTVGFTGVSCVFTSGTTFTITFAEDSADAHQLIVGIPLTAAATTAATAAVHSVTGVSRREDVYSDTRGWPICVTFHEGRLWLAGGVTLPNIYLGSVVTDFFNFEVGAGLEDDAVFGALDTSSLNAIRSLKSGRFLQLFTNSAEYRFFESPIKPGNAPRNQTEYGSRRRRPISVDGATLFIHKTGKAIRDFLFNFNEDAFSSSSVSRLSSHLLSDIQYFDAWQGSSDTDVSHVYVINGDGTLACYQTQRDQEIAAWSPWTTDGLFKDVTVVVDERFVAVRRSINGTNVLYLERFDDGFYTDCALQQTSGVATDAWSGFDHLSGEALRVRGDGFVLTNVTPVAGAFTSQIEVLTIEAGLDWHPKITTMPLNSDFGSGGNYMRKKRVQRAQIHVYQSLGVLYNDRPLPDRYFDLNNFDEAPTPFTGVHSIEETSNWDEGTLTQTISQVDPLPFLILGLDLAVETS